MTEKIIRKESGAGNLKYVFETGDKITP